MPATVRCYLRLLIFQSSWTYERLQGVGMGYASAPLLAPLARDPSCHRAALARAAEFFNANPYLAGIAVGAAARAELDGAPGPTVQRLRTALCGPLGSLGDQLFWIGLIPALTGAALALLAERGTAWIVAGLVVIYNAIRLGVTWWGLHLGLAAGARVGAALGRSELPATATRVGYAAGFAVGLAVPLVVRWYVPGLTSAAWLAGATGGVVGAVAALVRRRMPPASTVTLVVLVVVVLWRWGFR